MDLLASPLEDLPAPDCGVRYSVLPCPEALTLTPELGEGQAHPVPANALPRIQARQVPGRAGGDAAGWRVRPVPWRGAERAVEAAFLCGKGVCPIRCRSGRGRETAPTNGHGGFLTRVTASRRSVPGGPRRVLASGAGLLFLLLVLLGGGDRAARAQAEAAPRTARVVGVSTAAPYGGNLLVFKEPSQAAPRLGFISNGDVVQLITVDGFFARVVCPKFPDGGWVWGSYLQIEDQEAVPGGVGEPTLLRLLKEQEDAATRRDPARVRPMAPRADPALVASFGRLLKPATRR